METLFHRIKGFYLLYYFNIFPHFITLFIICNNIWEYVNIIQFKGMMTEGERVSKFNMDENVIRAIVDFKWVLFIY